MKRSAFPAQLFFIVLFLSSIALAQQTATSPVEKAALGKTVNVHRCGTLLLAGQPTPEDIQKLKEMGIERVISLRTKGEIDWDESAAMKDAGLEFLQLPLQQPEALSDDVFHELRGLLKEADQKPTLLHCGSANRVGAVWLAHRVLDQGVPLETALAEAKQVGLRSPEYEAKARDYIERHAQDSAPQSVRPGINDNFLKPDLKIEEWIGRFEVESREIFAARESIVAATGIKAGDRVADIGAGTGLFTRLFADAAAADGWVYAIDIAPRFIEHITRQAHDDRLTNVTAILCPADSISLPPQSIDVAFICDTYHHFEYPSATLASIHQALRSGGSLIVIDFERVAGESSDFVMQHVRAGKDVFRAEIEAAGFQFVEEVDVQGLKENYFLRFQKP